MLVRVDLNILTVSIFYKFGDILLILLNISFLAKFLFEFYFNAYYCVLLEKLRSDKIYLFQFFVEEN